MADGNDPPDAQKPSADNATQLLQQIAEPRNNGRERLLLSLLAGTLILLCLAGIRITTRVQNDTDGLRTTNDKATTAKEAVGTAKRKVDSAARVAKQANRRSIRTTRYLQGKAGINGAPGRNGTGTPPGPSIATATITEPDGTVHVCVATRPSEDVTC